MALSTDVMGFDAVFDRAIRRAAAMRGLQRRSQGDEIASADAPDLHQIKTKEPFLRLY